MLGSVALGHACHFRRCPDMTWEVFLARLVPCLALAGVHVAWVRARRVAHLVGACKPELFAFAALPYEPFMTVFRVAGGGALLSLALSHLRDEERAEAEAKVQQLKERHKGRLNSRRTVTVLAELLNSDDEGPESKFGKTKTEQLNVNAELAQLLDYDTVLVMGTFSVAIIYDVTHFFKMGAEKMHLDAFSLLLGMLS